MTTTTNLGKSVETRLETDEERPLVSICVSAYNVEKLVAEALRSILSQTYENTEIIVVDNGSADNTYNVVSSIEDTRLRHFRIRTNIGGYQAMNRLIKMAKGSLIAVYHSDDIYEDTIVEKEVEYLRAHPEAGAVFALEKFMDYDGRVFGGATLPVEFRGRAYLEYEDVFPFLLRNKNTLFCCPTFMGRPGTFDEVGVFNPEKYDIGSDLEMWLRILRRFPVGILNEHLMRYRVARTQWSNRFNYLRTDPDPSFLIMDEWIEQDKWFGKLSSRDIAEYEFHRCDDDTFRAANLVIQGKPDDASDLMTRSYPWKTLRYGIRRRKIRVLLLRALLRVGLAMRASSVLARFLIWTEYRGPKYSESIGK